MDQINLPDILATPNLKRMYTKLIDVLPLIQCTQLIALKQDLFIQLFNSCFDEQFPLGAVLLEAIFKRLMKEQPDIQLFVRLWSADYIKCIDENQHNYNLNCAQLLHRVIADTAPQAIPHLLNIVMQNPMYYQSKSSIFSVASLLRISKQEGLLTLSDKLVFKTAVVVQFDLNLIDHWLFNGNRAIQFEAFQIIALNTKKTCPPTAYEYERITQFIRLGLKTSYPNFRKNYITKLRFLFERIRASYEKDIAKDNVGKLQDVIAFTKRTLNALYKELQPGCAFEISNPCLEILKMIYTYLGTPYQLEVRKGSFVEKCMFLQKYCYDEAYSGFDTLLSASSNMWESSRNLGYDIINLLPKNLPCFTVDRVTQLYKQGLQLLGNAEIRWYECGAQMMSWLLDKFSDILFPGHHPQLLFLQSIYNVLQQRFTVFKHVFATDTKLLQQNLIHGYITAFWVIMAKNQLHTKPYLGEFIGQLLELLREIIEFATQLSSENACTWILGEQPEQQQPQQTQLQVDCRGHFYKSEFMDNVQKLLSGNTLIESLEEQSDALPENILVIGFFLITREAGIFFQQLATLLEQDKLNIVPADKVQSITYQFFHALLNIKHIGSIDRISQGLQYICKVRPQPLLEKLIDAFEQNQLRNVFRRSAGLPHLVCCLLKSQPLQTNKVVEILLKYSGNDQFELRIHSLNILRKLFLESQLKQHMDKYIGQAFIISIDGFSYDDWSVRNSSLMLFSSLALRVLGKNTNSGQLAHQLTLLEFFIKAPELVQYFKQKIRDYKDDQPYPSIYPIALLLSRLAPSEGKFIRKVDAEEDKVHKVNLDLVHTLLHDLVGCLHNKNYLGRQIVSKSLLPFLKFEEITQYAQTLLNKLRDVATIKSNHNYAHGLLLSCLQLCIQYYKIKLETQHTYTNEQQVELKESELELLYLLVSKHFIITEIKCPPVQLVMYQILNAIMKSIQIPITEILQNTYEITMKSIRTYMEQPTFKLQIDLSHSVLRKKQLAFAIKYSDIYSEQSKNLCATLLEQLIHKYLNNIQLIEVDDLEVLQFLYKQCNTVVKLGKLSKQLGQNLIQLTYQLFNQVSNTNLTQSVQQGIRLIVNISQQYSFPQHTDILLQMLHLYQNDGSIVKQIIKLLGYGVLKNQEDIPAYLKVCSQYSMSSNVDDLRIAVIKSMQIAMPVLTKSMPLYLVFLRLLQDEIPEIRNKIAKFISKGYLSKDDKNASLSFSNEFILNEKLHELLRQQVQGKQDIQLLITLLMESDYYLIKRQNHQNRKIYQVEKANKFYSDYTVRQIIYKLLIELIDANAVDKQTVAQVLKAYVDSVQNTPMSEFFLSQAQIDLYFKDFMSRDEYIYENLMKLVVFENLSRKVMEHYSPSDSYKYFSQYDAESSLTQLIQ